MIGTFTIMMMEVITSAVAISAMSSAFFRWCAERGETNLCNIILYIYLQYVYVPNVLIIMYSPGFTQHYCNGANRQTYGYTARA